MRNYAQRVAKKLQAWADTQDPTVAEVIVGHVEIHDAHDRFKPVRVDLRELSAEQLRYMFGAEAAARTGSGAIKRSYEVDSADQLRYAAARIGCLLDHSGLGPGDLRWPCNASSLVRALQLGAAASSELVREATETTGRELAAGRTVLTEAAAPGSPRQADAIKQFESLRDTAAQHLADAARNLEQLGALTDALERPPGPAATEDGATLVDEAVLEYKVLPFMSGIGRYHIRVFKPDDAKPLVVIGDLSDNQSTSVMNSVEEIAAAAAESLLNGAECHAAEWAQLVPAELFPSPSNTDVVPAYERERTEKIELVRFGEPFGSPDFRPIDRGRLEELAGGPVRSWHASNYTSAELVRSGARIIRPETRSRVPQPKRPPHFKVAVVADPDERAGNGVSADEAQRDAGTSRSRRRWWWPVKPRSNGSTT
ncbi:hypothetical protein SAMN05421805_102245 [Saccharopolyspora antimicrobica]|uniref:Uncharacterized protein n=1 Tax=Saccharopolyspora antimicrobica TaxID=455193 RepID=A0A1I4VJW5_9PSEU|nr:hypothetical protein [Saccharopolyspora antimicrobica]RKT86349.1 hypothetical protein ATL45_4714 [Saccharopolyspora antimicrobica]SFN01491.1 hypothetical protein SAMN05421805_102245 [Saccharopolyspora antimicrobica]